MKTIGILIVVILVVIFGYQFINNTDNNMASPLGDENLIYSDAIYSENLSEEFDGQILNLNLASSTLNWSAEKIVGSNHTGLVNFKNGNLILDSEGNLVGGEVLIDLKTISESKNNEQVVKHLLSEDFFAVEEYPEAKIILKKVAKKADGLYRVISDLEIKGVVNPVEFDLNLVGLENERVLTADFEINRTLWGVNYDSESIFTELGDKAIRDMIDFKVNLIFESDKDSEMVDDDNNSAE